MRFDKPFLLEFALTLGILISIVFFLKVIYEAPTCALDTLFDNNSVSASDALHRWPALQNKIVCGLPDIIITPGVAISYLERHENSPPCLTGNLFIYN